MSDRTPPAPGSIWRHCRSGNYYSVVGLARYAGGPGEADREFVVYRSESDARLWIRDVADFLGVTESGAPRFEEVIS